MRLSILTVLALLVLAAPLLAQEGGPSIFTQEEGQRLQSLQQQISDAFSRKEHEKGLGLLSEARELLQTGLSRLKSGEVDFADRQEAAIAQLESMIAVNWYNSACCLALTERPDEAVDALKSSIELGYMDIDHMKLDSDLDSIRNLPGYKALIEGLGYNQAVEFVVPDGAGENAPLLVVLHGSRENEKAAIERFRSVAESRGMILAAPRGPITLAKDAYDWRRYSDDEEGGLKKIRWTIDKAAKDHSVDTSKVYLVGGGIGGYFATLYGLMHPTEVAGVVSLNAYWNKYYFEDFLAGAAEAGLPVCLVQGKEDPFHGKAKDGVEQMTGAGVKAMFYEFDGGKELPEDIAETVKKAIGWIDTQ